jgi:hypothetical protein
MNAGKTELNIEDTIDTVITYHKFLLKDILFQENNKFVRL